MYLLSDTFGLTMSKTHYTVNDDIYGKILKTHRNLQPETEYAEVFEAVEGLGMDFIFLLVDCIDLIYSCIV